MNWKIAIAFWSFVAFIAALWFVRCGLSKED